jgi:hypothetical protein
MAELPDADDSYEIECPHCRRSFEAKLIGGSAARYSGFKCPHCRLFVPLERAEETDLPETGS